jgi:hypothetical protein
LRPDINPFAAVTLERAIAGIAVDDDPVVLAVDQ